MISPNKMNSSNKQNASILLTLILSLGSGLIGSILSPFFQAHLLNEQTHISINTELIKELHETHMEMTKHGWRLTIAKKAGQKELNEIHDSWLFAYHSMGKLLRYTEQNIGTEKKEQSIGTEKKLIDNYRKEIKQFYDLEKEELGLADKVNSSKGKKLLDHIEEAYIQLRASLVKNNRIKFWRN